jgi:pyridoxamine 5'-phosphate oxidase
MVIRYHNDTATTTTTTTTSMSTPTPEAPWRSLFLEHVGSMASPIFTLSTVRRERQRRARTLPPPGEDGGGERDGAAAITTTPRARTCVFRGMWAGLADTADARNTAPQNPPGVFASDLPCLTTDARMDKMAELFDAVVDDADADADDADAQDDEDGTTTPPPLPPLRFPGSGGGGPVEAVFWPASTGVQWRLRGRAYVLGPDIDDAAARAVRDVVGARMRRLPQQQQQPPTTTSSVPDKEWSWAREVTAHFGNLSPGMRGAFRNSPPGRARALPVGDARLGLGQRVDDVHDAVARRHFRVVVVVPDEVDRTDLSDPARPRRWVYYYRGGDTESRYPDGLVEDGWEKVEVWP